MPAEQARTLLVGFIQMNIMVLLRMLQTIDLLKRIERRPLQYHHHNRQQEVHQKNNNLQIEPLFHIRAPLAIKQINNQAFEKIQMLVTLAVRDQIQRACRVRLTIGAHRVYSLQRVGNTRHVRVAPYRASLLLQNELEHLFTRQFRCQRQRGKALVVLDVQCDVELEH